jgi:hypothetical protein
MYRDEQKTKIEEKRVVLDLADTSRIERKGA